MQSTFLDFFPYHFSGSQHEVVPEDVFHASQHAMKSSAVLVFFFASRADVASAKGSKKATRAVIDVLEGCKVSRLSSASSWHNTDFSIASLDLHLVATSW